MVTWVAGGVSKGARVVTCGAKDEIWGAVLINMSNHSGQQGIGNLECKSVGMRCNSGGMGCQSRDMGFQSGDLGRQNAD